MRLRTLALIILCAVTTVGAVRPAFADDDWRRHERHDREEWREREWRRHEWRYSHMAITGARRCIMAILAIIVDFRVSVPPARMMRLMPR
jgi:hypothetical protein